MASPVKSHHPKEEREIYYSSIERFPVLSYKNHTHTLRTVISLEIDVHFDTILRIEFDTGDVFKLKSVVLGGIDGLVTDEIKQILALFNIGVDTKTWRLKWLH